MNLFAPSINLIFAWLWITLGFISGFVFGLKFDQEQWQGGYGGYRRRLLRLGHISFFGLAIINALYFFTARNLAGPSLTMEIASLGFIVGGVSMPICCFTMAYYPKLKALFLLPVSSLTLAGILTLLEVARSWTRM